MSGHHGRGIHHCVAKGLRLGDLLLATHTASSPKAGSRSQPLDLAEHLARIDGHFLIMVNIGLAGTDSHQGDAILVRGEIQVVADMHRRHQKTQLLGELLAHPLIRLSSSPPWLRSTSGMS